MSIEASFINNILEEFNEKLNKAKVKQKIKLKEYELLQRTEFKKGFLNAEEKKFNASLKEAKEQAKVTLLEVGIKGVYYRNLVIDRVYKAYSKGKAKKVIRYVGYSVDESIDLTKKVEVKIDEKKKTTLNTLKNELEKLNSVSKNKVNEITELETTRKDLKRVRKRSMW